MLKEYIERSGETQTVWAKRLGIGKSYLSDLLNGKSRPSLELAVQIHRLTDGAVSPESWIRKDAA